MTAAHPRLESVSSSATTSVTLLTREDVLARTALSDSGLKRAMKNDGFPKPILIAKRRVAWVSTEVDEWIRAKIATARGGVHA